jgi:hypothetical protein
MRQTLIDEIGAEFVESDPAHGLAREPAREAKAGSAQPGMSRSDT